jgi:phage terminase small subunit
VAKRGLNAKQRRFCLEYVVDLNATQAAIRAGYSPRTAGVIGHKLLKNAKVEHEIAQKQQEIAGKTGINAERVLQEYGKIAFLSVKKLFDSEGNLLQVPDMPDEVADAIAGLDVSHRRTITDDGDPTVDEIRKVKLGDKLGALNSLAKHLGMFEKDNSQRRPSLEEAFTALEAAAPELAKAVRSALEKRVNGHK